MTVNCHGIYGTTLHVQSLRIPCENIATIVVNNDKLVAHYVTKTRYKVASMAFDQDTLDTWNGMSNVTGGKLLVIVNVFGGHKNAMKIFLKNSQMLIACQFQLDIHATQYKGHATDIIIKCDDLESYYGIISVGGDGTAHEIINGLMRRSDSDILRQKINLCFFPAGTSNAACKSLGIDVPCRSLLALIQGNSIMIDLLKISHVSSIDAPVTNSFYGHLSFLTGFLANVDLLSDNYRWMGDLKITTSFLIQLIEFRKIPVTLHYYDSSNSWTRLDVDELFDLTVMNQPYLAKDLLVESNIDPCDGQLFIQVVNRSNLKRKHVVKCFLSKKFSALDLFMVQIKATKLFVDVSQVGLIERENRMNCQLGTTKRENWMNCDGEGIEFKSTLIECCQGLLKVCVPKKV